MLFGQEHVETYLETGGEVGHEWQPGVYTLLLTTRGRRTGQLRTTPLIYGEDRDAYVVVASVGGADSHPGWYHNLVADPEVEVQVASDVLRATARDAEGDQRERLWRLMADIWPAYDDYAARTDRTIPVVVLTPRP